MSDQDAAVADGAETPAGDANAPRGESVDYDSVRQTAPVESPEDLIDPWWVWALTALAGLWLAAQIAWTRTVAVYPVPQSAGAQWEAHGGALVVLLLQLVLSLWLLVHLVRTAVQDRLRGRDGVLTLVACLVSAAMALVTWAILR